MKVLDAGAYGVIVPMVNNRAEAEKAVEACRYPPQGGRSFGPIRAGLYAGAGYADEANQEIACVAMIETAEALENLDEIMSTPGLDGVYIGPSDLAYAIGLKPTGDNNDPKHVQTVNRIFDCAKKHGIAAGIHTGSAEYTQRYLAKGFNLVTLGQDHAFLARLARRELRQVRKESGVAMVEVNSD
jgi:4-hydroxy-2-oxoheptanedioate aldolase